MAACRIEIPKSKMDNMVANIDTAVNFILEVVGFQRNGMIHSTLIVLLMESVQKKKKVSILVLCFNWFYDLFNLLIPLETLYSTYVSIEKAIHNKRALILNHEDTIEWTRINRARIIRRKERWKKRRKRTSKRKL